MKLIKESLNENMGYKDFFGNNVSHEDALKKRLQSLLVDIVAEEWGVSEKSFRRYDEIIENVKNLIENDIEIMKMAEEYYQKGKRLQLLAEQIYDTYHEKIS
jgi:hypothetical protein